MSRASPKSGQARLECLANGTELARARVPPQHANDLVRYADQLIAAGGGSTVGGLTESRRAHPSILRERLDQRIPSRASLAADARAENGDEPASVTGRGEAREGGAE
jgi:hypothetical protein